MMTDVNVNLSRWPFRRLPHDETTQLVAKLKKSGITQAWAGSFDGILHRDIASVNQRLADDCQKHGADLLIPFGSVNPTLPDWQDDLRRCAEDHKMPGIRLHPNYHGYQLAAPEFEELLQLATKHKLLVQLAVSMEDDRTQHPLVRVPAVDVALLKDLAKKHPESRLILLNALRSVQGVVLSNLAACGNIWFEISHQESVGGVGKLLNLAPLERVLFGSHFPFFYLESAVLKMTESELGDFRTQVILRQNAEKLLRMLL